MATNAVRKLTAEERSIVTMALSMLSKSQDRAIRSTPLDSVKSALKMEMAKTDALLASVNSGELEL